VLRPRVTYTLVSRFSLGLMVEALSYQHFTIKFLIFGHTIIILLLQLLPLLLTPFFPMNGLVLNFLFEYFDHNLQNL
jgi:hypothetical protein